MMYVTTIDVTGLTAEEYRAVLDEMGVETRPAANIYLQQALEDFLAKRLGPANAAFGIEHEARITVTPLHDFFGPRLQELPDIVGTLPGARRS